MIWGAALPAYAAFEADGDTHDLIWSSNVPNLSISAIQVAASGIVSLLPTDMGIQPSSAKVDFDEQWTALVDRSSRRRLSPTTAVLMQAALLRGLPCERLGRQHLQIGHGRAQRHIYASMSATTSITAQKNMRGQTSDQQATERVAPACTKAHQSQGCRWRTQRLRKTWDFR